MLGGRSTPPIEMKVKRRSNGVYWNSSGVIAGAQDAGETGN